MGRYAFRASRSEIGAISTHRPQVGDGSRKRATSRWWRRGSGCARAMLGEEEALLNYMSVVESQHRGKYFVVVYCSFALLSFLASEMPSSQAYHMFISH